MSRRGPWRALGIDPGSDRRAIRRAYAERLKAIDVDADPAAFIALREAMEQALREDAWRLEDEAEAADEADPAPAATILEFVAPPLPPVAAVPPLVEHAPFWRAAGGAPDPAVPAVTIEVDADVAVPAVSAPFTRPEPDADEAAFAELREEMDLLSGLLFGDAPADRAGWQIELAWQQIMRNPMIERIDVLDRIERWFAGTIARSLPRSDPLVWPAIQHFAWSEEDRKWNGDPAIASILQRQRDLYFFSRIAEPGSAHHTAYGILQKMPGEATAGERIGGEAGVRSLLRRIRFDHPTAEWNFDEAKIAAWIEFLEAPRRNWWNPLGSSDGKPVFYDEPAAVKGAGGSTWWYWLLGFLLLQACVRIFA